ncbi:MAG: acetyl-CoA C-acetyltransferase [Acidimicrobiia bacterium]|jgi:acetyl-CoA acetyltransferase|nr:acetyl-CoA C-acetyltransferase [Acidimicrobiia bacterium]
MSLRGAAAITGIAERKPTRWTDGETTLDMFSRIAVGAVEDAGLQLHDIDGVIAHPMAGVPMLVPSTIIELLGLRTTYAETVDLGGATGAAMVWRAAAAIAAGQCNAVLCVTASRRQRRDPAAKSRGAGGGHRGVGGKDTSAWAEFEVPYGNVGANIGYAMIAQRYMHDHGVTPEQLARIAVHQRDNACQNPDAFFYGQPITVDDVLNSEMVADPLHFLEIVMPAAGAAALVVVHPDLVRSTNKPAAWLLGAGECTTHKTITYAPSLSDTAIRPAADRAFAQAGVARERIGLASLYDCYTITVLVTLEEAGFCKRGEGGRFVAEHDLRWNGDFPLNTHGGQLSFSQPGLAGGMSHVTEAARQVQQRGGDRQVKDLELAFVNGNGGIMSEECALVLGVEP